MNPTSIMSDDPIPQRMSETTSPPPEHQSQRISPVDRLEAAVPLEYRNSVAKRPRRHASRRGSSDTFGASSAARISYLRRSTASTISRAQSPYQGATGPSHPYALYSQDANISRPVSSISTPENPFDDTTHPANGAYPPGSRVATFWRPRGPDGEDLAGLSGPGGYSEQLPAYSRYANDIPPKRDPDAASSFVVRSRPPSSRTIRRPSVASSIQDPFQDPVPQVDEKTQEPRPNRLKRRVCWDLLPCWLLTVIVLVVCLAAVLGGVIGGMLARSRSRPIPTRASKVPPTPTAAESTTYAAQTPDDGVIMTTPISIPTIPTGSFAVTLNDPSITSNSCLTDARQNNAWDCSTGAHLNIIVNSPSTKVNSAPVVALLYPPSLMPHIRYGSQPPQLRGYSDLLLMQDKRALSKGLAYAFQQPFNKTVIVRERHFPAILGTSGSSKRDLSDTNHHWFQHESDWESGDEAQPGDRPWYCFWNNTILEGFIYVSHATNITTPAPGTSKSKRQAPAGLAEYPKEIKVEERRKGIAPSTPYCQQFRVLDDFALGHLTGSDGLPIIVNLTEHESFNPWLASSSDSSQNITNRPCCSCAWTNTA